MSVEDDFIRAVEALIRSVDYDENGVGGKGGNGGLLSRDTLHKMGEARQHLHRFKQLRPTQPPKDNSA